MPKFPRSNSYTGRKANQSISGDSRYANTSEVTAGTSKELAISPYTLAAVVATITATGITWSDRAANFTVSANTGSTFTAACTLTLPATPADGTVCVFFVGVASAICIVSGGAALIKGSSFSATTATSTNQESGSLYLVYRSTGGYWQITSITRTWT